MQLKIGIMAINRNRSDRLITILSTRQHRSEIVHRKIRIFQVQNRRHQRIEGASINEGLRIHVVRWRKIINIASPRLKRLPFLIPVMVVTNLMISQKREKRKIRTIRNLNRRISIKRITWI